MRDSWHQETTGPGESVVFSTAPYAGYLFSGTAAHVIRAASARALHFYAGGTEVFAREVQHPGTAPSGPLLRALDDQLLRAQGELFDYGVREMAHLARSIA